MKLMVVAPFLLLAIITHDVVQCEEKMSTSTSTSTTTTTTGVQLGPIVKIPQGQLQGSIEKSRAGDEFYGYWGIPYAQPPKRFQPPEPAEVPGWAGVRNATVAGNYCTQAGFFGTANLGEEDCLLLNVFTKSKPAVNGEEENDLKPVLVYIHGGAFYVGSGQYHNGGFFMDEPLVYVTINYRLGPHGFLNIGQWGDNDKNETNAADYSQAANGNMGLKDQSMALKWIQENIKAFGGDPSKVTIFGTSAGGASVSYHLLSPMSTGLFHNAIAASGSALNAWALSRNPNFFAKKLGEALHCPTDSSNELLKCLLEKDANDIAAKGKITRVWSLDPVTPLGPSIESRIDEKEAFLSKEPKMVYEKDEHNKVPLMIGATKNEGLFIQAGRVLIDDALTKQMNDNWTQVAPVTFEYEGQIPSAYWDSASVDIRAFYLGPKCISLNESEKELDELYSDRGFLHGVRQNILYHAKSSSVFPYIFDYNDGDSAMGHFLFGGKINLDGKVLHGEDLKYAFPSTGDGSAFLRLSDKPESVEFSKKYIKLVTSFVTNGKPDGSVVQDGTEWPAVSPRQVEGEEPLQWFHLNPTPTVEPEPEVFTKRMKFWDDLLKKYAKV